MAPLEQVVNLPPTPSRVGDRPCRVDGLAKGTSAPFGASTRPAIKEAVPAQFGREKSRCPFEWARLLRLWFRPSRLLPQLYQAQLSDATRSLVNIPSLRILFGMIQAFGASAKISTGNTATFQDSNISCTSSCASCD